MNIQSLPGVYLEFVMCIFGVYQLYIWHLAYVYLEFVKLYSEFIRCIFVVCHLYIRSLSCVYLEFVRYIFGICHVYLEYVRCIFGINHVYMEFTKSGICSMCIFVMSFGNSQSVLPFWLLYVSYIRGGRDTYIYINLRTIQLIMLVLPSTLLQ